MTTPAATWDDILGYADSLGLSREARHRWAKERKIPNRWRAAIASCAITEGKHIDISFYTVHGRTHDRTLARVKK